MNEIEKLNKKHKLLNAKFSLNFVQSLSYYLGFISFGMIISSLGPSIPVFVKNTGAPIGKISFLFTTYNLGILVGSFSGGILFDKIKGHIVLFISLIINSILFSILPYFNNISYLLISTFIIGIFLGIILVGGNTLIIWVNKTNINAWMNGLHMFSGIGAFISPLIISFLLGKSNNLKLAYLVISIYILFSGIFVFLIPSPEIRKLKKDENQKKNSILPVLLISIMFLLYVGSESGFGGWIYVYTISRFPVETKIAGIITSIFWGMLILGRFFNILLAIKIKIKPYIILIFAFIGSILGIFSMIFFSHTILNIIIITMISGLFMSSIFPTIMTFSEKHIGITGKINSIFFISTSIGAMLIPTLIGKNFEIYGEKIVMQIILVSLIFSFFLYGFVLSYFKHRIKN